MGGPLATSTFPLAVRFKDFVLFMYLENRHYNTDTNLASERGMVLKLLLS